jgi:multiple sugar transport system substrate-binding protein
MDSSDQDGSPIELRIESLTTGRLTRRQLLQTAGVGLAGAALAPALAACSPQEKGVNQNKLTNELSIVQWAHFVPAYDSWFDKYAEEWGTKNKVTVTVDHVQNLDLPGRLASESAARTGHDIIQFSSQVQTYRYEKQLVDVGDIVAHATQLYGNPIKLAKDTGQVGGVWRAMPDFYIIIAPLIRDDLLAQAGNPKIETWEDVKNFCGTMKRRSNNAAGLAISHCNDANHNWRAVMWSYGASEVAKDGKTITVNTPEFKAFLEFSKAFFQEAITPEVFAWDDVSDNRYLGSGQGSFIHDAISSIRSIEAPNKALFDKISIRAPLKGPGGQHNMPDSVLYAIWEFAKNKETAKKFLTDYLDIWKEASKQSTGYNMPYFENLFKKPMAVIGDTQKLAILQDYKGDEIFHTFGYPGPPNSAAQQVLAEYIIPDTVGFYVKGDQTIAKTIDFIEKKLKPIYRSLR